MKRGGVLVFLAVLFCFTAATAQELSCEPLVARALASVEDSCFSAGRNQACYAYIDLNATPREDVEDFEFDQQGDLVNVADVQSMRLSALDVDADTWGIALMRLQANLPDTLPGQNVTFLMFGDVEIENAVEPGETLATLEVTSGGGINVRTGPSTDYAIAGSLASSEVAVANGRNEDGSWVRIQIPESDALGWVFTELVALTGDVSTLSVVDADDQAVAFAPMQAFYFRTGIAETTCADAPADGILIQTPEGVGTISLRANDVDIQLGSTAFLQAEAGNEMTFSVVEGAGAVTADGVTVEVPAGTQVGIPIDENLRAVGAPADLRPYNADELANLPIEVLPRTIVIAAPLDATQDVDQPAGDFGGALPGLGGDLGEFADMDLAFFCPIFDQSIASAGMTRDEYINLMGMMVGMVPAEDQDDFQAFLNLLASCP